MLKQTAKNGKAEHKTRRMAQAAVLALTICTVFAGTAFYMPEEVKADANVSKMDISVVLDEDGMAEITQQWDTNADDGTEYYLYFKDSGYLYFDNLTVSDENGDYENIGDWDVYADFDEKANCCGINQVDDGVELCWGISEYGENHYTISYTVENLVAAYDDENGFLYRFVNSGMDVFPSSVDLTIEMADGTALSEENAQIWGFGYDGQIVFENGKIHAWTDSDLVDDENMTLMVGLNTDLMEPEGIWPGENFSDVIDQALEDSDYIEEYVENNGYDDGDSDITPPYGEDYFEYDGSQWWYVDYVEAYDGYIWYSPDWDDDTWGYYDDENDSFVDLTSYIDTLDEVVAEVADENGDISEIYYYMDGSWEYYDGEAYDDSGDYYYDYYYEDDSLDGLLDILPVAFFLLIGGVIIYSMVQSGKKEEVFKTMRIAADYYKQVPLHGDLDMAYVLALNGNLCQEGSILSARIIRLVMLGAAELREVSPADGGYPSDDSESEEVLFLHPEQDAGFNKRDRDLMDMLLKAAKGEVFVTKNMLDKYIEKHSEKVGEFLDDCLDLGKRHLEREDLTDTFGDLTEKGTQEYINLCGLYKFIQDYDTASGNTSGEADWIELLPYAVLFDLVEEFDADLESLYSEEEYRNYIRPMYCRSYFYHDYNRIIHNQIVNGHMNTSRSGGGGSMVHGGIGGIGGFSGGGGGASFGGGGGFSGGGGGGHR